MLAGGIDDLLSGHHDAKVNDLVVVALQDDPDDVLADVVHVALDCRHDDRAVGVRFRVVGAAARREPLGLDEGDEIADGFLHHPSRLDDLGEEHLAGAEEVADDVHAVHQRAFDDLDRSATAGGEVGTQLLGVGLDVRVETLDEGVRDPLPHGQGPPGLVGHLGLGAGDVETLGHLEQALGGVGPAVEDDVLDALAQLGVDLVVDDQGTGVDDPEVHPGADRVQEEHRVDRLTDRVVAAEAEGHVGDAAGHQRAGEVLLDPPGGLDEVDPVGRVLLDAGRHREDVGVDDDVFGRVADLVDKDPVCRGADLASARQVVGLALLVEGHDDDGGAVFAAEPGVLDERLDAFLHGDRVDDRLALDGLEAGLDDLPLGRVDHDRDPADVRLAGHQLEEAVHGRDPVDHSFVHVDVDDLSAGLDLLPGDGEGGAVVAGLDEFAEARRAGDVGPLADVDEQRLLVDRQRLQPGQPGGRRDLGNRAGRHTGDGGDQLRDVLGGRAATAADDVDQARRRELADDAGHRLGALVVFTERVG